MQIQFNGSTLSRLKLLQFSNGSIMAISVLTITLEEKGRRSMGKNYHHRESKHISKNPVADLKSLWPDLLHAHS